MITEKDLQEFFEVDATRANIFIEIKKPVIKKRQDIKLALRYKYHNLTKAAKALNVKFNALSNVIHSRIYTIHVIQAIQEDLNLTDEQVLEFWPLLDHWPKKSNRRIV